MGRLGRATARLGVRHQGRRALRLVLVEDPEYADRRARGLGKVLREPADERQGRRKLDAVREGGSERASASERE